MFSVHCSTGLSTEAGLLVILIHSNVKCIYNCSLFHIISPLYIIVSWEFLVYFDIWVEWKLVVWVQTDNEGMMMRSWIIHLPGDHRNITRVAIPAGTDLRLLEIKFAWYFTNLVRCKTTESYFFVGLKNAEWLHLEDLQLEGIEGSSS